MGEQVAELGLGPAVYQAAIEAVDGEAVRRAAARYLRPQHLLAVVVGDPAYLLPGLLRLGPVEIWERDHGARTYRRTRVVRR